MDKVVKLFVGRDSYDIRESMGWSMTVGELIAELENYDDNAKVVFSNDNGYTYGIVNSESLGSARVETFEEEREREEREEAEAEAEMERETYLDMAKELCSDLGKTDADIAFCAKRLKDYADENGLDSDDVQDKCWDNSLEMFNYIYA